jgi:hypothetical protein
MQALFRVLMLVFLISGLALSATSVSAQQFSPPLPPEFTPQWAPIPGAPGVQHAPNANADLFRYGQRYYFQHDGKWYQARNIAGPWQRIQNVPRSFRRIEAPYFKQPPGWAKGKKTGWGGAPMPPGQMKKQDEGQHMPPGQMKKQDEGQHMPPGQMKKQDR